MALDRNLVYLAVGGLLAAAGVYYTWQSGQNTATNAAAATQAAASLGTQGEVYAPSTTTYTVSNYSPTYTPTTNTTTSPTNTANTLNYAPQSTAPQSSDGSGTIPAPAGATNTAGGGFYSSGSGSSLGVAGNGTAASIGAPIHI